MITAAALDFLAELAANNERAWFTARKAEYQTLLLGPMRELVGRLSPIMLDIDPALDCDPRGGAISRIHRDTRFSRDKSPYRVNQWIAFKIRGEGWQERPAFFMEFGPGGWRCGMGFYAAGPATMRAVRDRILARPSAFVDADQAAKAAGFVIEGEPYARSKLPDGVPAGAEDWWRLKTAYYTANHGVNETLLSPNFAAHLAAKFIALAPAYAFLKAAS